LLDITAMKLVPCSLGPSLTFEEAQNLSPNFSRAATLPEKTSEISPDHFGSLSSCRTDFLFAYNIFPRLLTRAEAQIRERRTMRIGDIIVQRAVLPPIGFGICAEFAVRISALIGEPSKLGFAYERAGEVLFVVRTHREPAHWLSRLGRGVFSLRYQRWCTQQALKHVNSASTVRTSV
jgi:hypothetical protein